MHFQCVCILASTPVDLYVSDNGHFSHLFLGGGGYLNPDECNPELYWGKLNKFIHKNASCRTLLTRI